MGNLFACCTCFKNKRKNSCTTSTATSVNPSEHITEKLLINGNIAFTTKTTSEIETGEAKKTQHKLSVTDFKELKLLGKGTFGKVLLVKKHTNQNLYAMKVLDKETVKLKNQEDHTKTERQILEKVNHPFIVHLEYAFKDDKNLYLVTEFMQGGELFFHLRREGVFRESRAKFYMCEIVLALEYLHENNCIYRDLKPENILLGADGHIKLTDFGLSKLILSKKDEKAFTICGTYEYLAPEINDEKGYDKAVDWWSLGALFYEMLAGFSPFKSNDQTCSPDMSVYTKPIKMHNFFSEDAKFLLRELLNIKPKYRLGSGPNGSKNVKSHVFFKGVDWEAFSNKKVDPPFKPRIDTRSQEPDLNNFDRRFIEERIHSNTNERHNTTNNTIDEHNRISQSQLSVTDNYIGFTYIKNSSCLDEA